MQIIQILLLVIGLGLLGTAVFSFVSSNPSAEAARRLQALRLRHSDRANDRVEAQLKKALAARRPRARSAAGSHSRIAALNLRLHRTGKTWTVKQYVQASLALGGSVAGLLLLVTHALMLSLLIGVAVGAGIPHMAVSWLINKRGNAFVSKFPDGIELLVRGLRSGLPVTETLGVVASEIPGPVGQEFKLVTERMKIGRSLEDALQESADRLNTAEFSFFCITLAIQRETGGNLAETLSNLADVLRKRAQMKLKIKAMSSEAKASAYIIGALPFLVFLLVEWANPQYLSGFFHEDRLIIAGLGGLTWMGIGVFIMAQMINFEI